MKSTPTITGYIALALLAISSSLSGQVSTEEALARLQARQAQREANQPTTKPTRTTTTRTPTTMEVAVNPHNLTPEQRQQWQDEQVILRAAQIKARREKVITMTQGELEDRLASRDREYNKEIDERDKMIHNLQQALKDLERRSGGPTFKDRPRPRKTAYNPSDSDQSLISDGVYYDYQPEPVGLYVGPGIDPNPMINQYPIYIPNLGVNNLGTSVGSCSRPHVRQSCPPRPRYVPRYTPRISPRISPPHFPKSFPSTPRSGPVGIGGDKSRGHK